MQALLKRWWEHRKTIPVWVGGLRPHITKIKLIDASGEKRRRIVPQLQSNDRGAVEARIPKKYRDTQIDMHVTDPWFKHQYTPVTIERYGLFRAVMLERDYTHLHGGGPLTEKPPPDVTSFDPAAAHEAASAEATRQARQHANLIPVWSFNGTVAFLTSYLIAILTAPWVFAAGLLVVTLGMRALMTPYLDGRRPMTLRTKIAAAATLLVLIAAIVTFHVAYDARCPIICQ